MKMRGQSTIEFTFTLVAIAFLSYGLVQIFRWTGMDLAERRFAHDQVLLNADYRQQHGMEDPNLDEMERQLTPDFYRPKQMQAVNPNWHE